MTARTDAARAGTRSSSASAIDAGPIVINRNCSDGGYFVVRRNERTVKMGEVCADHGDGSPYMLAARTITNAIVTKTPVVRRTRRRRTASMRRTGPHEKPRAMTANHGISG